MSLGLRKVIRDKLVDDATFRSYFGATLTGSCPVNPAFMEQSGVYPQVVYTEIKGTTDPGMAAENSIIQLSVIVQATGGAHPIITYENILKRIEDLLDDTAISGVQISGTGFYIFHCIGGASPPLFYDENRKTYTKAVNYSVKSRQQ